MPMCAPAAHALKSIPRDAAGWICVWVLYENALSIPQDIPLCSDVTARQVVPLGVGKVLTQCQRAFPALMLPHLLLSERNVCMRALDCHKHCEAKSRRRISAQCQEPFFCLFLRIMQISLCLYMCFWLPELRAAHINSRLKFGRHLAA